jgi:hypothetical protein
MDGVDNETWFVEIQTLKKSYSKLGLQIMANYWV